MNSRERFLTALKGGIPDRVPVSEYLFSLKLQKEVMDYYGKDEATLNLETRVLSRPEPGS